MRQNDIANWNYGFAAKLIKDQGRKSKWVAGQVGITDTWLRAILSGRAKPSVAVVKCLAQTLGVNEDVLFKNQAA